MARKDPPLPRRVFVVILRVVGGWSPQTAWTHKGHAVEESENMNTSGFRTEVVMFRRIVKTRSRRAR